MDRSFRQEGGETGLVSGAAAIIHVPDIRHLGDWLAGLAIAAVCLELVLCLGDVSLYRENALIELSQCVLLWIGGALFIAAATRARDSTSFLAFLWLSLLILTFLVREIEFEGTRFEEWRAPLFDHEIKYAVLAVFGLLFFLSSLGSVRPLVRAGMHWAVKGAGRWMLAGLAAYLLGDLGEKHLVFDAYGPNLMLEESAELLGALCIFICAHTALRRRSIVPSILLPRTP